MRYSWKAGRTLLVALFATGIVSAGACDSATAPIAEPLPEQLERCPSGVSLCRQVVTEAPVEVEAGPSGTDEWVRDVMEENGREADRRIPKAPVAE